MPDDYKKIFDRDLLNSQGLTAGEHDPTTSLGTSAFVPDEDFVTLARHVPFDLAITVWQ